MLQVQHQVGPAQVRLELCVASLAVDLPAHGVQRRHAGVAAAGDVDRREVERQAEQVVAQRLGDELVDLVAGLAGHPAHDGAGGVVRIGATGGEGQRVEEGRDQAHLLVARFVRVTVAHHVEVGVVAVDRLGQHRVAEAVHRVGELGDDRGVQVDVVDLGRREEQVDVRLDGAGELLEHQVLVLHLGAELGGLEQPLAVPHQCIDLLLGLRHRGDRLQQPFVDEVQVARFDDGLLGLRDQAVVLGVEHVVHRGQADVLVDPAVTGDVVRVEQFVVVLQVVAAGAHRHGVADVGIGVGLQHAPGDHRHGVVGDVVEEGMAGAYGVGQADRRIGVAFDQRVAIHHHLREAVVALDEVAVGVGGQQRHVEHVGVGQVDAEEFAGLGLDHRPGGHAADRHVVAGVVLAVQAGVAVGDQVSGGDRPVVGHHVLAQEHLVRRVRAVGLVLVDEGRGGVGVLVDIVRGAELAVRSGLVGGAGQHHEVGGRAFHEQRIVRLQLDEHGAGTALGDQVETVVEELAEEGHPGVERRRQAFVRRDVREQEHVLVVAGAELAVQARALDDLHALLEHVVVTRRAEVEDAVRPGVVGAGVGGRVVGRLVDQQVADGARLRVEDEAAGLRIGRTVLGITEVRIDDPREGVVGRAELGVVDAVLLEQVVGRTVHRAQAEGHADVRQQGQHVLAAGVGFGDPDLVEDEVEVGADHLEAHAAGGAVDHRGMRHRRVVPASLHGAGGLREDHLGGAMAILVERLDPQVQAGEVGGHAELAAIGALEGQVAGRQQDDVLEHAGARVPFHLPDEAHRAVGADVAVRVAAGDVVGVLHAGHRHGEHVAHRHLAARRVGEGRPAGRRGVAAGQFHGLVGELQPLDVHQGIAAVVADVVGDPEHAVAAVFDGVVDAVAGEHRGIVGRAAGRCTRQDFTHGLQLAGAVGAGEHERDHLGHAVEAVDLGAGMVDVISGIDGDAHVQPLVAVDQVVAATALDDVAAVAAEEDVAGGEAVGGQSRLLQQFAQAVDQVDVGQRAAGGAAVVEDGLGIDVVAADDVAEARAGCAFHFVEAVEDRRRRGADRLEDAVVLGRQVAVRLRQDGQGQVDGDADLVVLVGDPVEAGHAFHLVLGIAADEDVVAALADHFVEAGAADEDVVTVDLVGQQRGEVVAGGAVLGAHLDPVVALVAGGRQAGLRAEDEVVALAAEGGGDVLGDDDEVLAVAAEDQVAGAAGLHAADHDHVVAGAAFQAVVAEHVADDVVAVAAEHRVVAGAAFQTVVAGVAPDGVVAGAGDDHVVAVRAAHHHVVAAGVAQVVAVGAGGFRVVADDQRRDFDAVDGDAAGGIVAVQAGIELPALVDLQGEGRGLEDGVRQVDRVGVQHHHLGERVVLQLGAEVHPGGAGQVVEAVAVLQGFQLGLEDEVEARAEHAAERHLGFGQAADPEVHRIQAGDGGAVGAAGPGTGAVEEVEAIAGLAGAAQHQQHCRGALAFQGGRAGDGIVRAIGGDEVDQRRRMLEVGGEVGPAQVRLELVVAGHLEELAARLVQRGDAGIAAAGDVDRRQVERQAEQVVAQRLGDELVDLVAGLAGHPAHDGAGGVVRIGATGGEGQRVEEGRDQAHLLVARFVRVTVAHHVEVGVVAVDRLGQHRVAEAVHRVGELGDDRGVQVDVVDLGRREEQVDVRLDGAGELLEHQVLVLHLGAELGGLEQAFAVPHQRATEVRQRVDRLQQPLVDEGQVVGGEDGLLGLLDQAVVLGVEHMVHGGQADVLVDPAVAGDVVRVEQLVVVGAGCRGVARHVVEVGGQAGGGRGAVGDVIEEGVAGVYGVGQADRRGQVAFDQRVVAHHHQREAVVALDEVAIGIGGQQRHVEHVGIGQVDAEDLLRLRLDHRPGGHAADRLVVIGVVLAVQAGVAVGDQAPGGHWLAVGVEHVLAQEHLVRRVRAVGLVLVDEGRGGVGVLVDVVGGAELAVGAGLVGGAGNHHEAQVRRQVVGRAELAVGAGHQRIVRLQRYEHHFGAALGHQVEAVVEELAEEGHPRVEACAQALVGRLVGDEEHLAVVGGAEYAVEAGAGDARRATIGFYRRRIIGGLVNNQVADGARLRVDHRAGARIGGAALRRPEHRVQQAREQAVGGAEGALSVEQVVVAAIYRAQAEGHLGVGQQVGEILSIRVGLGDEDLLQDEFEVGLDEVGHFVFCLFDCARKTRPRPCYASTA
ncbi:hypothetical protein D9M70_200250 [compost metagenome]